LCAAIVRQTFYSWALSWNENRYLQFIAAAPIVDFKFKSAGAAPFAQATKARNRQFEIT